MKLNYDIALKIIEVCIQNNIIGLNDEDTAIYKNADKSGWLLIDKNDMAKKLIDDNNKQKLIFSRIKDKNIDISYILDKKYC